MGDQLTPVAPAPMFRSIDEALRWSYRVHWNVIVQSSSITKWMAKGRQEGRAHVAGRLTSFELHGQAGIVLRAVAQLDEIEQWYVAAMWWWTPRSRAVKPRRHGGKLPADPQRRFEVLRAEFERQAVDTMVTLARERNDVRALPRDGLAKILRRWRGERVALESIRYSLACRKASVNTKARPMGEYLNDLHDRVLRRLDYMLKEAIESND